MSCNAVDLQNVYLWLVLSAGGLGGALGALLTALRRRLKPARVDRRSRSRLAGAGLLVRVSLLLSAAALAVLGGIIFIELPQIEWSRSVLYFFLFAVLGWMFVYLFFRWLIIPLVLVVVLYLVLVSGVVRQWNCCQSDEQLLRIKVIAQQPGGTEKVTKVEVHGPAENRTAFQEIEGDTLRVLLSTVRFKPWVFYPRCAFLFRVHSISGLTVGSEGGAEPVGIEDAGLPLRVLLKTGIVEMEQLEVVQSGLQVLSSYLLVNEQNVPKFRTQR